jgi:hypothetical protein
VDFALSLLLLLCGLETTFCRKRKSLVERDSAATGVPRPQPKLLERKGPFSVACGRREGRAGTSPPSQTAGKQRYRSGRYFNSLKKDCSESIIDTIECFCICLGTVGGNS